MNLFVQLSDAGAFREDTPHVTTIQELADDALLDAFAGGRESAFTMLVERHSGAIKGYATRMLQSPQEAEEVYVETFLRLARQKGRWENRGTVRSFLFTVAHRRCLDILRQRKVTRDAVPHLVDLSDAWRPSPSPEAAAVLGQEAAALEAALARLPTEHRQVLLLRVVHGLSSVEAGEALGLSAEQVDSQVSYARKRLRAWLSETPAARRREES